MIFCKVVVEHTAATFFAEKVYPDLTTVPKPN